MTVPMEHSSAQMSKQSSVQKRYDKVIELEQKAKNAVQMKIPSDPNTWSQMRENYEAIILEDHDFAESHEIEHALWTLHYKRIEDLRARLRSCNPPPGAKNAGKRDPARDQTQAHKIRAFFKSFLAEAAGFYHELILKIKSKYGMTVDYFSNQGEDYFASMDDKSFSSSIRKARISCHRCLIYLGDLARYKESYGETHGEKDYSVAANYYNQAARLWPLSGNPHHQLAILAAYCQDDLLAVYRYFRSLAVEFPFSTARDNLIMIFDKNRQKFSEISQDSELVLNKQTILKASGRGKQRDLKPSSKDQKQGTVIMKKKRIDYVEVNKIFRIRFVRLNGILFTRTSLETFDDVCSCALNELDDILSQGFESEMINGPDSFSNNSAFGGLVAIQLISILIFTVHNILETVNQNLSYSEVLQRAVLLQNAFTATFEFVGRIVRKCGTADDIPSCPFLPAVLLFMEWLGCRPDVVTSSEVEEQQSTARTSFWTCSVSFLNKLIDIDNEEADLGRSILENSEDGNDRFSLALWEDFELRGFLPIVQAHNALDFSKSQQPYSGLGGRKEKIIRIKRTILAGKSISASLDGKRRIMYFDENMKKFCLPGSIPESKNEKKGKANKIKGTDVSIKAESITKEISNVPATLKPAAEKSLHPSGTENPKPAEEKSLAASSEVISSKVESCSDEDEDEVILFQPVSVDKHAPVTTQSQHNLVPTSSIQNLAPESLGLQNVAHSSNEIQRNISRSPVVNNISLQIPGYSTEFGLGRDNSLPTGSSEVPSYFGNSTNPAGSWSPGFVLPTSGISTTLDGRGAHGYNGSYANNYAGGTSFTDLPLQASKQQLSSPWFRNPESNVINGMMNLNVGNALQRSDLAAMSENPLNAVANTDQVSAHSNWITSQGRHSFTPAVSNLAVGPGIMSDRFSTVNFQTNSEQPKMSTESSLAKFQLGQANAALAMETANPSTIIGSPNTNSVPGIPKLGLKKGPANRPVRHFGPPPGFGPVPSKASDCPKADSVTRVVSASTSNDQQQLDDYSWLDGYSASNNGVTREGSTVSIPTNDKVMGAAMNFPFPGKQVPTLTRNQDQVFDYQQLHIHQQLQYRAQQQLQQQKQNVLPNQQQQQSLWSGQI